MHSSEKIDKHIKRRIEMAETKNKPADIIYPQMLLKTTETVAPLSYGIAHLITKVEEDVSKQILSLAATLICMLQKYDLNHIDVLSIAENIVHSDDYNNMQPAFKTIMNTFKDKEEI